MRFQALLSDYCVMAHNYNVMLHDQMHRHLESSGGVAC
jgi:hypothetical protein